MKNKFKVFLVLFVINWETVLGLEPITSSVVGIIGAIGLGTIYSTWDYLKCSTHECCHKRGEEKSIVKDSLGWHREPWIDYDLKELDRLLNVELHGQHLVKDVVSKLIRRHLKIDNPKKALVLSFHGWTGGGKNFVANIVAKSIYRKYSMSGKSDFVRYMIGGHFNTNDIQLLREWIRNNVTNVVKTCERSLFVFDEVDKLPVGVIDVIKPFIDYHNFVEDIDYRKNIFIFLSNTGGTGITKLTYKYHLEGKERTDLTMKDLEPLMTSGAFNEDGGLHKSDIIEKNLVDAFIPFLPLERKHVKLCITDYLKHQYNKSDPLRDPGEEFIRHVISQLQYFPPDTQLYSRMGCKMVAGKVDTLL